MIAASTAPLLLAATNRKGWDRASPESTGLSVRRHAHGAQSAPDPPTCAPPPPLDAAAAKLLARVDVSTGKSSGAFVIDVERAADHLAFLRRVADEVRERVVADVGQFGRGEAGGEQEQRRHREYTSAPAVAEE